MFLGLIFYLAYLECDNGFLRMKVWDKDLALVIMVGFWIISLIASLCNWLGGRRRTLYHPVRDLPHQAVPDVTQMTRNAVMGRLETGENDEIDTWNREWSDCKFTTFLGN